MHAGSVKRHKSSGTDLLGGRCCGCEIHGLLGPHGCGGCLLECVCKAVCTCLKPEASATVAAECEAQIVVVPSQILTLKEVLAAERLGEHSQFLSCACNAD